MPTADGIEPSPAWEKPLAVILLMLVGARLPLPGGLVTGDLVALAALPMTWTAVRRSRVLGVVACTAVVTAAVGYALSLALTGTFTVIPSSRRYLVLSVLALPAAAAALAWGARRLGLTHAALAMSTGMLLTAARLIPTVTNPWKFAISLTATVVVLAIIERRNRLVQVITLLVLALIYLANDSRGALGFIIIILVTVCWQAVGERTIGRHLGSPRAVMTVQVGVMTAMSALVLIGVVMAAASGALGADAQTRTIAQSSGSTNILIAARPEATASFALIANRPWGYGAGVVPDYEAVRVAMHGMSTIGYDPDNNYVLGYMLGHGFELHSAVADLWATFSLPGVFLALLVCLLAFKALGEDLLRWRTSPWLLFVVLNVVWNTFFSPYITAVGFMSLLVGVVITRSPGGASQDLQA